MSATGATDAPPMNILHLLDPRTGGEGSVLACREAMRVPGSRHEVWVLGSPDDLRDCRAIGLADARGVTYSLAAAETARRSIWRLRQSLDVSPDVVISWAPSALAVAIGAWEMPTSRSTISPSFVGVMPVGPSAAGDGWLSRRRLAQAHYGATIVPVGRALETAWSGALGLGVTAVPAPIPRISFNDADRSALRAELRIAPDETAILLLADPPSRADGRRFAQAVGMARIAGLKVVGLMHRQVPDWDRALTFVGMHRREWDIMRIDGRLTSAFAAADICLWDPGNGPTSIGGNAQGPVLALAAVHAGIPVAAPDAPVTREVLGSAADLCLASGWQERALSGRLAALAEPGARERAIAQLRAHQASAGSGHFQDRLIETLRIVRSNMQSAEAWWDALKRGDVA